MNGRLIRERLLALDLSDAQFAVDLGCSTSTVQNMKRGQRISERMLHKAAKRLGVTVIDLLSAQMPTPTKQAVG